MSTDIKQTISRVREMQQWRRGEGKWSDKARAAGHNEPMPHTPKQFGMDIDALIAFVLSEDHAAHKRLAEIREMKTGAKHTPGPWVIEERGDDSFKAPPHGTAVAFIERPFATPHCIKSAQATKTPLPSVEELEAEALANARLIAAAPDLFKACRLALYVLPPVTGGALREVMAAVDKVLGPLEQEGKNNG